MFPIPSAFDVARQTLLTFAPLRWLLNSLDAIPIDRDGIGLGGLKETLRRLLIPRTDPWGKPLPGETLDGVRPRDRGKS